MIEDNEPVDHPAWPLRTWLLLATGAAFGLAVHILSRGGQPWMWTEDPLRMAAAAWLAVGGIVFAFTLERLRWAWSAAFAALSGLVVASVTWRNGLPQGWGSGEGWQLFSSLLAVAVAVPLFQAARDSGDRRIGLRAVHSHVWTNVILWFAAWAFVVATFVLALLLSELFHLIGLDVLRDLMRERWFDWMIDCGALGAAIGLLRDADKVLGALQRVARVVLSVLAPVLALGLVVFVLALPFTGLQPLWSQTKATTPILLACMLGAVVLINAVVGNGADEEAKALPLRAAALALAAVMLPLALVAALSTGKRIAQYGCTPDRLWAGIFVAVAAAAGTAYLLSLILGRRGWAAQIRRANVRVAAGVFMLALVLALPLVSFGSISARDQLARLQSGKVPADKFDWAAMRFDFGPAGRHALQRLAASGPVALRQRAAEALKAGTRLALLPDAEPVPRSAASVRFSVDGDKPVPQALRESIGRTGACAHQDCRLILATPTEAMLLSFQCAGCEPAVKLFEAESDGTWAERNPLTVPPQARKAPEDVKRRTPISRDGKIELRTVAKRQVFVDGQPVGSVFD